VHGDLRSSITSRYRNQAQVGGGVLEAELVRGCARLADVRWQRHVGADEAGGPDSEQLLEVPLDELEQ